MIKKYNKNTHVTKHLTLPGWKTSYRNFVTTSETKFESAFAKNGTEATNDLQL